MNKGKRLQPEFAFWASLGPASVALVPRRVNRTSRCCLAPLGFPRGLEGPSDVTRYPPLGSVYFPWARAICPTSVAQGMSMAV
jgi:hypothetical protein